MSSKTKKTVADVAEEVINLDTKMQTMERVLAELVSKHEENQTDMVSRIEENQPFDKLLITFIGLQASLDVGPGRDLDCFQERQEGLSLQFA